MSDLGPVIYSAVKPIIRMYLVMLTGFFLTRAGLFGVSTSRALSDLVLLLFLPCLILDRIISNISIHDIKSIGVIFLSATVMYSLNFAVSAGVVYLTPIPKKRGSSWVGGAMLAGILSNVSDLPIAYLQAMTNFTDAEVEKGIAYVIIWLATYVIVQFNCGAFRLIEYDFRDRNDPESDIIEEKGNQHLEMASYVRQNSENASAESGEDHNSFESDMNKNSKLTPTLSNTSNDEQLSTEDTCQLASPPQGSTIPEVFESRQSDIPISPVSSISSSGSLSSDILEAAGAENTGIVPVPLTSSGIHMHSENKMARTLSHASSARIPSARSHASYEVLVPTYSNTSNSTRHGRRQSHDSYSTSIRPGNVSRVASNSTEHTSNSATGAQSLTQELIREYSRAEPYNRNISTDMNIVTETNLSSKDVKESGKSIPFVERYNLHFLVFFVKNFKKPNAIALVVGLIIALIPWTKALFVATDDGAYMPNAPDAQPPLSFILQYLEYCASPCVPIGLILIGSLLGRLQITSIPKGFWKSVLIHTAYKLAILPIIGVLWTTKMKNIGWLDDPMCLFVMCLEFSLPSPTVQAYLTASAMRPDEEDCTPMNCLSLYYMTQYGILFITLPVLVCYTIKNVI